MVAGAAWLAKMVLLQVHHFVHECREHVGRTARREVLRIECDFIGQAFAGAVPACATIDFTSSGSRYSLVRSSAFFGRPGA